MTLTRAQRLFATGLLGAWLFGCEDSLRADFPGFSGGPKSTDKSDLPGPLPCSPLAPPPIDRLAVDPLLVDQISPPGTLDPSGVPSPGPILRLKTGLPSNLPVVAPAAGAWSGYFHDGPNVYASFFICEGLLLTIGPLEPVDVLADGGPTQVAAGDTLGIVQPGASITVKLDDAHLGTGGLLYGYENFDYQAACPYRDCVTTPGACPNYMTTTEASVERTLVRDTRGARPLGQECGEYPIEQAGTALGAFARPETELTDEDIGLFFTHDPIDTTRGAIVALPRHHVATTVFGEQRRDGLFVFNINEASGAETNLPFERVSTQDGGPGPVHCYEGLTYATGGATGFVVLVQMMDPAHLRVGAAPGNNCASVKHGEAFDFTGVTPVVFVR